MKIDKSIFDKYQRSLLDSKYIDWDDPNLVYVTEDVVVKPLSEAEYQEMGVKFSDSGVSKTKVNNIFGNREDLDTSEGEIESTIRDVTMSMTQFTKIGKTLLDELDSKIYNFSNMGPDVNESVSALINNDSNYIDKSIDDIFNKISDIVQMLPSLTSVLFTSVSAVSNVIGGVGKAVTGVISGAAKWITSGFKSGFKTENFTEGYNNAQEGNIAGLIDGTQGIVDSLLGMGQTGIATYSNWLAGTLRLVSDSFTNVYIDGVTETSFGQKMEESWRIFVNSTRDQVVFNSIKNPVLNLGVDPILFGAPPRYNKLSDPRDRSYMNTFIKDGNILSIIPGKPKYNGLRLTENANASVDRSDWGWASGAFDAVKSIDNFDKNILGVNVKNKFGNLNDDGGEYTSAKDYSDIALMYLKKNGISEIFNNNDKRYYTFEENYSEYYSYLETMLNTIYVRMGLGEKPNGLTELFTFFDNVGESNETLMENVNGKSLGFYFDGNPSVSEGLSNDTSDPAGLKSQADSMSDEFQRINYISGFGVKNNIRRTGIATARISAIANNVSDVMKGGNNSISKLFDIGPNASKTLTGKLGKVGDSLLHMASVTSSTDLNAITESLLSTNGMRTQFPMLWSESNYGKNITVDFEFVSPYGDPLSIFQHCYVPLAALLALAIPKQAEENGYINPFFLRLDIPGVISSDFSIISNISWVRGGSHNIWTADRHPRAITVSVTFEDLYNFMAMTKRISFLSANPNYSMFLDSFSGIKSLYTEGNSVNNDYWNLLVNRLSSKNKDIESLWNSTQVDKEINIYLENNIPSDKSFFRNYYKRDLSWMKPR